MGVGVRGDYPQSLAELLFLACGFGRGCPFLPVAPQGKQGTSEQEGKAELIISIRELASQS